MKSIIKELRVKIDGLSQLVKNLKSFEWIERIVPAEYNEDNNTHYHYFIKTDVCTKRYDVTFKIDETIKFNVDLQSQNLHKCYDSLILGKAWLGKVLGELNVESPYNNDGIRKTVEDIEPTADKSSGQSLFKDDFELLWWDKELNHIEKVDWLRQEIQHVIHLVEQSIFTTGQSKEFAIARTNSYNHLCEARFWLGFELERIKNESLF